MVKGNYFSFLFFIFHFMQGKMISLCTHRKAKAFAKADAVVAARASCKIANILLVY
jgi:hypothetical protein